MFKSEEDLSENKILLIDYKSTHPWGRQIAAAWKRLGHPVWIYSEEGVLFDKTPEFSAWESLGTFMTLEELKTAPERSELQFFLMGAEAVSVFDKISAKDFPQLKRLVLSEKELELSVGDFQLIHKKLWGFGDKAFFDELIQKEALLKRFVAAKKDHIFSLLWTADLAACCISFLLHEKKENLPAVLELPFLEVTEEQFLEEIQKAFQMKKNFAFKKLWRKPYSLSKAYSFDAHILKEASSFSELFPVVLTPLERALRMTARHWSQASDSALHFLPSRAL